MLSLSTRVLSGQDADRIIAEEGLCSCINFFQLTAAEITGIFKAGCTHSARRNISARHVHCTRGVIHADWIKGSCLIHFECPMATDPVQLNFVF